MPVRISRSLLDSILAAARADPQHEVCGILLGDTDAILEMRPAANVAPDRSCRFEIDPVVLLKTYREARAGGRNVIGHYHSHPGGRSSPSPADAAEALDDDILWLIIGGSDDVGLWRTGAGGQHGRFQYQQLVVEP